jgi:hypothetical protein
VSHDEIEHVEVDDGITLFSFANRGTKEAENELRNVEFMTAR